MSVLNRDISAIRRSHGGRLPYIAKRLDALSEETERGCRANSPKAPASGSRHGAGRQRGHRHRSGATRLRRCAPSSTSSRRRCRKSFAPDPAGHAAQEGRGNRHSTDRSALFGCGDGGRPQRHRAPALQRPRRMNPSQHLGNQSTPTRAPCCRSTSREDRRAKHHFDELMGDKGRAAAHLHRSQRAGCQRGCVNAPPSFRSPRSGESGIHIR